ncbi:hypothetical protein FRC06_008543 [Ceratobasidium sp. 370]|nr:hypothetical protein FRC06_008543 [Ceratobasidium sp. 370]
MRSGDQLVLYLQGHGIAGEPTDTPHLVIQSENFDIPADLWERTIQANAQSGTNVATIDMDRLSSDLSQRGVTQGNLSAGGPGSDAHLGATRITIPSWPQGQQADGSTFEIQLPETPEYYSDSIEMLSIALDSISEIMSTI